MSRKRLIFFVLWIFIFQANAQVNIATVPLKPAPLPGTDRTNFSNMGNFGFPSDGKLFFATAQNGTFRLHSYEGVVYRSYPAFQADTVRIVSVISFRDTILLVGMFANVNGTKDIASFVMLKGNTWDTVSYPILTAARASAVVNNKLYVVTQSGSSDIFEFNHWNHFTKVSSNSIYGDFPSLIARDNQRELIALRHSNSHIYKYRDGSWDSIFVGSALTSAYHFLYNDTSIYIYNPHERAIRKLGMNFQLDTVKILDTQGAKEDFKGLSMLGDKIIIGASRAYDLKTDVTDTSNGLQGQDAITYANGVPYGIVGAGKIGNVVTVSELTNGAYISGKMYLDSTANCAFDAGDRVYGGFRGYVITPNATQALVCAQDGTYSAVLPPGLNSVRISEPFVASNHTACGIQLDTILKAGQSIYNLDIPFGFLPNKEDISVNLVGHTGFRARQGFKEMYTLVCKNEGTVQTNFDVYLEYPDSVTWESSSITPTTQMPKFLHYTISGLQAKSEVKIKLEFTIHVSKSIGSALRFVVFKDTVADLDSFNNSDTLIQKVVAAYDPNSKQSVPEGVVYEPVSLIKYQINFQNMGTDTAYRVLVVDSFVPNFPLEKLQMKGASHGYNLIVRPGNVLIWEFNNIKLPPVKENPASSKGFVKFEAPLREPTKKGQIISNRAHIYFDYQKAVITDWDHVIHSSWGGGVKNLSADPKLLRAYPNPTSDILHLEAERKFSKVYIYDVAGVLQMEFAAQSNTLDLDLQELKNGIYILHVPELGQSLRVLRN